MLYINSPGGSVTAGMAIYDTMQYIKCEVSTLCIGMAASMGAFLLAAGAKGKRACLPNAEVMIHQPSGGAKGQATDIAIVAEQIIKTKERMNRILAERTGQSIEKIARDVERDHYMWADEALSYGIVDKIVGGQTINFPYGRRNKCQTISTIVKEYAARSVVKIRTMCAALWRGRECISATNASNCVTTFLTRSLIRRQRNRNGAVRSPSRHRLKRVLDDYVIGQEKAKKALAPSLFTIITSVLPVRLTKTVSNCRSRIFCFLARRVPAKHCWRRHWLAF